MASLRLLLVIALFVSTQALYADDAKDGGQVEDEMMAMELEKQGGDRDDPGKYEIELKGEEHGLDEKGEENGLDERACGRPYTPGYIYRVGCGCNWVKIRFYQGYYGCVYGYYVWISGGGWYSWYRSGSYIYMTISRLRYSCGYNYYIRVQARGPGGLSGYRYGYARTCACTSRPAIPGVFYRYACGRNYFRVRFYQGGPYDCLSYRVYVTGGGYFSWYRSGYYVYMTLSGLRYSCGSGYRLYVYAYGPGGTRGYRYGYIRTCCKRSGGDLEEIGMTEREDSGSGTAGDGKPSLERGSGDLKEIGMTERENSGSGTAGDGKPSLDNKHLLEELLGKDMEKDGPQEQEGRDDQLMENELMAANFQEMEGYRGGPDGKGDGPPPGRGDGPPPGRGDGPPPGRGDGPPPGRGDGPPPRP